MNRLCLLILSGSLLNLTSAGFGQNAVPSTQNSGKPVAKTPGTPLNTGGAVVAIDPDTKELRQPTPDEMRALAPRPLQSLRTAPLVLQTVQGPGNAVGITLGDSITAFALATKSADGKVTTDCVTGAEAAQKGLRKTPPAPKNEVLDVQ